MAVSELFIERSIHHLREEYLPRLSEALAALPEEDLWWRPHEGSNSVGNLLLHLEGNVQQWIVSGIGGENDDRVRSTEFAARNGDDAQTLLRALGRTMDRACEVIRSQNEADLAGNLAVQGFEVSVLEAIYHVVEHFAWHTGQIVLVAKYRGGEDHGVAFYDDARLDTDNLSD